jgi:aspartate kinase
VDLVATSEVSVSMTVDAGVDSGPVARELGRLGPVTVLPQKSIICLVGRGLFRNAGVVAAVFAAVEPAHVHLISLGSSEINLSLVVDDSETEGVQRRLHERGLT